MNMTDLLRSGFLVKILLSLTVAGCQMEVGGLDAILGTRTPTPLARRKAPPQRPSEELPARLWTYDSRDVELGMADPVVSKGVVYLVASPATSGKPGKVAALEAGQGKILWETQLNGLLLQPPDVGEKQVFVLTEGPSSPREGGPGGRGNEDGSGRSVQALDRRTGARLWTHRVHPRALGAVGARAYWMVDDEGYLVALRTLDGVSILRSAEGAKRVEAVTWSAGRVFRVADESVEAYDETRLKLLWSHSAQSQNTRAVADGDRVYLYNPNLTAIDAKSGEDRWVFPEEVVSSLPPVLRGGALFAFPTGDSNSLCSVDPKSGKQLWRTSLATTSHSWTEQPIAVDKERVYVKGRHELYGLELKTGRTLWSFREPESPIPDGDTELSRCGPTLANGKVWVTSGLGFDGVNQSTTLRGFDGSNGDQLVHCERAFAQDSLSIGQGVTQGHLIQGSRGKCYCFK